MFGLLNLQMDEASREKWDLLHRAYGSVCCMTEFFDSWEQVCWVCVLLEIFLRQKGYMGGLLEVEGWIGNEVRRSGNYIIECLNIFKAGTQWGN